MFRTLQLTELVNPSHTNITGEQIKAQVTLLQKDLFTSPTPIIDFMLSGPHMNVAWESFTSCKPYKDFIKCSMESEDYYSYYKNISSFIHELYSIVQRTSDQKMTLQKMFRGKISQIYDSWFVDTFHKKPAFNFTISQIEILERAKIHSLMEQRFKFKEQAKFGLYKWLKEVTDKIQAKIEDPGSPDKFLGMFGHDTNIQNFFKIFMTHDEILRNKHRIPAFAATLSWQLFQVVEE